MGKITLAKKYYAMKAGKKIPVVCNWAIGEDASMTLPDGTELIVHRETGVAYDAIDGIACVHEVHTPDLNLVKGLLENLQANVTRRGDISDKDFRDVTENMLIKLLDEFKDCC
jgi:hypothetical protein